MRTRFKKERFGVKMEQTSTDGILYYCLDNFACCNIEYWCEDLHLEFFDISQILICFFSH